MKERGTSEKRKYRKKSRTIQENSKKFRKSKISREAGSVVATKRHKKMPVVTTEKVKKGVRWSNNEVL